MGVFSKLYDSLRDTFLEPEAPETKNNQQGITLLEEEIVQAKQCLAEARVNLAELVSAQSDLEQRTVIPLKNALRINEYDATLLLKSGNETRATEIAEKIAVMENELATQQGILDSYTESVNHLRQTIKNTERNILRMEREIKVIKTTAKLQKADAVADKLSTTVNSTTGALQSIKDRQQKKADELAAALQLQQESAGDDLQAKLKAAGIISGNASSNTVLERLKTPQKSPSDNQKVTWTKNNRY